MRVVTARVFCVLTCSFTSTFNVREMAPPCIKRGHASHRRIHYHVFCLRNPLTPYSKAILMACLLNGVGNVFQRRDIILIFTRSCKFSYSDIL